MLILWWLGQDMMASSCSNTSSCFLLRGEKNKDSVALEKGPCGDCVEPKSLWNTLGKSVVTPLWGTRGWDLVNSVLGIHHCLLLSITDLGDLWGTKALAMHVWSAGSWTEIFSQKEPHRFLQKFSASISKSNSKLENNGQTQSYIRKPEAASGIFKQWAWCHGANTLHWPMSSGGLHVMSSSPWNSAGISTVLLSVFLQVFQVPDPLILRTTMAT